MTAQRTTIGRQSSLPSYDRGPLAQHVSSANEGSPRAPLFDITVDYGAGGEGSASAQSTGHREASNCYAGEICRVATAFGNFRVVICRDGIQWIIQRLTRASGGPHSGSWRAIGYLTTRAGVERLWAARTKTLPPSAVLLLPSRISQRLKTSGHWDGANV